jgi:hypothetical protein
LRLVEVIDKSLALYRQCSTGRVRPAEDFGAAHFGAGIVDILRFVLNLVKFGRTVASVGMQSMEPVFAFALT